MSTQRPKPTQLSASADARFGIAAARFNAELVEELLSGCLATLELSGVTKDRIEVVRIPGAFELPLTAKALARTGRFSAIICLGAVVRGETAHFDHVAGQCARGIQDVSLSEMLPVIFGVLTTDTHQQALDRLGGKHGHAGRSAAEAAVEMVAIMRGIKR